MSWIKQLNSGYKKINLSQVRTLQFCVILQLEHVLQQSGGIVHHLTLLGANLS